MRAAWLALALPPLLVAASTHRPSSSLSIAPASSASTARLSEPVIPTAILAPAQANLPAIRISASTTTTAPIPTGLNGLPFAPAGLERCDEMNWYRVQWGLPERFESLGWRESNCRNDVKTYCCYGYWQLYINLFLKDYRLGPVLRSECKIEGVADIFGNLPLQKQKQACGTRKLYDLEGLSPWAL